MGGKEADSLCIASHPPDLEAYKATAWCVLLRLGHLDLNLSFGDKWIQPLGFPCSL